MGTAPAERLRSALLRRILKAFDQSDWMSLGLESNTLDKIRNHPRLLRSMTWEDPDYAEHAMKLGAEALDGLGLTSDSTSVSRETLDRIEDVFRLSLWLPETDPALHSALFKAQGAAEAAAGLEKTAKSMSIADLDGHVRRIRRGLVDDPLQAIGEFKALLETVCKEILSLYGNSKDVRSKDLPELAKAVRIKLQLEVSGQPGDEHRVRIYSALTQIAMATGELRNLGLGTGHGISRGPKADEALADLVVTPAD